MCGEPRAEHVGRTVTLAGWVARRRDHGGLVFVDLRDRSGITQLVINPERAPEAAELAARLRNEFVLQARGEVVARSPDTVNPRMETGRSSSRSTRSRSSRARRPLPFQLDEENVDETLRLRYRWLDLRREKLQRNLRLRAQMVGIIRRHMEDAGFLDIQTPILYKSTPEGARDFVVPSRLHKGRFFALPQSPQTLKQLTMIAGFDRYYQIAICFRDEDLRADRVQELTQLDVEMSFPDQEMLVRPDGADVRDDLARLRRRRDRDAVAADDVRGGRPQVRLRQARHALRRSRSRTRRRPRAARSSASSPAPRQSASSACRGRTRARRSPRSRRSRRNAARRASRTCPRRRERRAPLADREVPLGAASSRRSRRHRARRCCSRPTRGRPPRRCSGTSGSTSVASSG